MGNIIDDEGMGYTKWASFNCSDMVNKGRRSVREAAQYDQRRRSLETREQALREKGVSENALELMQHKYANLTAKKLSLTETLKREKTLTAAWKRSPELYYQEYKATNGMGWPKFLKRMVGGISKVVTGGKSCNGHTRDEYNSDLNKLSVARAKFSAVESKYNTLRRVDQKSKDYLSKNIVPLEKEVKILQAAIGNERKIRNQIMVTYEAKKRAKELALAEQAKAEALRKTKISNAKATAVKTSKEVAKKADDNKSLLIGGGVAIVAIALLLKNKKAKK